MKCAFYSYCNEPRYLCCNFCSDKKCTSRCEDDHRKCKYFDSEKLTDIDPEKPNHIIKKKPQIDIDKIIIDSPQPKKRGRRKKDVSTKIERIVFPKKTTNKKRGRPKKVR